MQLKIRIVDAKFLQFTYEGHILVLVPTGGDLLYYWVYFLTRDNGTNETTQTTATLHANVHCIIVLYVLQYSGQRGWY